MKALRFALRLLSRDWRSGELQLLAAALVIAVAAISAVGFFTDRVRLALELQASEMLAADLVIETSDPPPAELAAEARRRGLSTARTLSFPSVVFQGERPQLVQVKAVDAAYPLRGMLRISKTRFGDERPSQRGPRSGEVWVEPRLLALLDSAPGTALSLGEAVFRIGEVLRWEPDRGGNLFRLAPRVMLALSDLEATQLVTPASRVNHRLLIAGEAGAVQAYRRWVETRLPYGAELESLEDARPELRSALDQGSRFLGLAALAAVLISGVAVALSTRRFVERQADTSAILRCLGAKRSFVLQVFFLRLLGLALLASLIGALLGLLVQNLLAGFVGDWFNTRLPVPSALPLIPALGTGLITLTGFALAPLLRLGSVSPLRVLRRDLGLAPPRFWLVLLTAAGALAGLMIWQAGDARMALLILGGTALTILTLLGAARVLVHALTPLRHRSGAIWRYGLAALARNPQISSLQLTGFGIGIMALLLLAIVRVDLLSAWEQRLPARAPNQFLINIQPGEVTTLQDYFRESGLQTAGIYPMLRGRLSRIGQHLVSPEDYTSPRAQRLAAREFNLSWSASLPTDNRIVAGRWWRSSAGGALRFSVEEGIARSLGIQLGDRLEFVIAGETVTGPVTSLRSVQWDSFQPNFFVIASPGALEEYPATYITSFFLPPERGELIAELARRFPSVTVIDVSAIMGQVRSIMERGTLAVETVFLFTLVAGVIVLYAGIQSGRELRIQESAVLRTLGLRRNQLLAAAAAEFATLGLLAGLLASLGATVVGYLLAEQVFQLGFSFNPWLWVAGLGGGGLGVMAAGVAATYPLLVRSPVEVLRRA